MIINENEMIKIITIRDEEDHYIDRYKWVAYDHDEVQSKSNSLEDIVQLILTMYHAKEFELREYWRPGATVRGYRLLLKIDKNRN